MKIVLKAEGINSRKDSFNLKNIDLKLKKGEILLVAGRNGSGKTTLLETLAGINRPTEGTLNILSNTIYNDHFDRKKLRNTLGKIGILLQNEELFKELTVEETFTTFSSLYPNTSYYKIIEDCPYIKEDLNKKISSLSEGKKQLTKIILSLGNKPSIVILDEPSANLDEDVKSWLFKKIKKMKGQGTSFVITSNESWEIGDITDKLLVLEDGIIKESIENYHNYHNGCLIEISKGLDENITESDYILKKNVFQDMRVLFTEREKSEIIMMLEDKDFTNYNVRNVQLKDFYPRDDKL